MDSDELKDLLREYEEHMRVVNGLLPEFAQGLTDSLRAMGRTITTTSNQITESTRSRNDAEQATTSSVRARKKAEDEAAKAAKKREEEREKRELALKETFVNLNNAIRDVSISFGKYDKAIDSSVTVISSLVKQIPLLGTVLSAVTKGAGELVKAHAKQADAALTANDELSKIGGAGQILTKDLLQLGIDAGLTSDNLKWMTNATKQAGTSIMSLGGLAGDGQKRFMEMLAVTKEQRESFRALGVSQEELMGFQAEYVKLQAMSGMAIKSELRDKEKLRNESLKYVANLTELSALTGESKEAIAKRQQEVQMQYEEQVATLAEMNKIRRLEKGGAADQAEAKRLRDAQESRKFLTSQLAGDDKELAIRIGRMMRTGAVEESTQGLAVQGFTPEKFLEMQKALSGKSDEERKEIVANFRQQFLQSQGDFAEKFSTAIQYNKALGEQVGLYSQSVTNSVNNFGKDFVKLQKDASAKVGAPEAGVKGEITAADKAQELRNKLAETEIEIRKKLEQSIRDTNIAFNDLKDLLTPEKLGLAALTAAALGTAAALAKANTKGDKEEGLLGGIISGIGGFLGNRLGRGKAGAAGAAGGVASAAGGGLSQLSSVASAGGPKGFEGLMTGAANGLKAFANPQVALGAVGVGAAITAIGAGIAGATWIMGKALPSLAEGLKSFTDLDGDRLANAGKGVAALGAGLGVFGVGGAAAGIGSIISNLSEGLIGFFGGKTPIDKLVEFSKLDIDAEKTKNNAIAFAEFSAAMAASGIGSASSGLGNLAAGISDAVNGLFGQKKITDRFDDVVKFSKLDIDSDKTEQNAIALAKFSAAMAVAGTGTGVSGIGNLVGGIADGLGKLFGNDTVIEKFVKFTKLDVDPERAGKLAQAFRAYTEGMTGTKLSIPAELGTPSSRSDNASDAASRKEKDELRQSSTTLVKTGETQLSIMNQMNESLKILKLNSNEYIKPKIIDMSAELTRYVDMYTLSLDKTGKGGDELSELVASRVREIAERKTKPTEPESLGKQESTEMPEVSSDLKKYLQATALIESGGNAKAKAGTSSAGGMFQFIDSTWNQTTKQMGKNYTLQDKYDPAKATEVMEFFTKQQKAQLEKSTGQKANNTDLYMAHFLGAGGAGKFINAMKKDSSISAASLDPNAARANKNIYYTKDGRERSLAEVYKLMGQKMANAESAVETGKWGKKDIPDIVKNIGGDSATQVATASEQQLARLKARGPTTDSTLSRNRYDEQVASLEKKVAREKERSPVVSAPKMADTTEQTPKTDQTKVAAVDTAKVPTVEQPSGSDKMLSDLYAMMNDKFDRVISILEDGNSTRENILKTSVI